MGLEAHVLVEIVSLIVNWQQEPEKARISSTKG